MLGAEALHILEALHCQGGSAGLDLQDMLAECYACLWNSARCAMLWSLSFAC